MNNIVSLIPSTIDELKQKIQSSSTELEKVEYLAEIQYVYQIALSQNESNESSDLDDAIQDMEKKVAHPERVDNEQIRSELKKLIEVSNKINSNKKDQENFSSDIKKIIYYAEKEIKKLGGKPEKWIEYPLVTNVHDFNVRKESMKDEGRLLEWVKWLLNNVELPVEENEGIKKDLGWSYNDRVLRQAKLDCIEQGKEYVVQKWDASNLDNDFVDHLERQLKTNTDLLPSPPENKHASVAAYPTPPENNLFKKFEKIYISNKRKPHSAFVVVAKTLMKIKRSEAWKELVDLAQKSTGYTGVILPGFGKSKIYLRRVRLNPHKEILYSHEPFDHDEAKNLPDGVEKFNRDAFNTRWQKTK